MNREGERNNAVDHGAPGGDVAQGAQSDAEPQIAFVQSGEG
jgi:hypothetical protein